MISHREYHWEAVIILHVSEMCSRHPLNYHAEKYIVSRHRSYNTRYIYEWINLKAVRACYFKIQTIIAVNITPLSFYNT